MLTPQFYKSLEERLGPVVGIAAGAAIVLNVAGYLSLRFRLRALGVDPELGVVSEIYLFEGASMVFFLFAMAPLLLGAGLVVTLLVTAARRVGAVARGFDALAGWIRDAPPHRAAVLGTVWALVTVQFFLRHILDYRDLVHRGLPCDPPWLAHVAISGPVVQAAFFGILVLLPIPTLWAFDRLADAEGWRPATVLIGLVALTQVLLVPIHHGVLVSHRSMPRLILPEADPNVRVWEVFRSDDHYHLLVRDDASPHPNRLRTVPADAWGTVEIEAMDSIYGVLTEDRTCP